MTVKLHVDAYWDEHTPLECHAHWEDTSEEDGLVHGDHDLTVTASSTEAALARLAGHGPDIDWAQALRVEGALGETIPDVFLANINDTDEKHRGMSFDEFQARGLASGWMLHYHVGDPYNGLMRFDDLDMDRHPRLTLKATVIGRRPDGWVVADNQLLRLLARAQKVTDGQAAAADHLFDDYLPKKTRSGERLFSPWMPDTHGYWHTSCPNLKATVRNLDTNRPMLVSITRTFDDMKPLPEAYEEIYGWNEEHSDQKRLKDMAREHGWIAVHPGGGHGGVLEILRAETPTGATWPRLLDHANLFEAEDGRRTILASPYKSAHDIEQAVHELKTLTPGIQVEVRDDSWYYPDRTVDLLVKLED